MTMQEMTVRLPETVFHRLLGMAKTTHQSVDEVLSQSIRGNLPPLVDDLPPEMRDEVARLAQLSDTELWAVVDVPLSQTQWRRHEALLEKNAAGEISPSELDELARLRDAVDRWVLRRSYAAALLKWRGYAVSLPEA
jgi:predicted transcriptional regulator